MHYNVMIRQFYYEKFDNLVDAVLYAKYLSNALQQSVEIVIW